MAEAEGGASEQDDVSFLRTVSKYHNIISVLQDLPIWKN